MKKIVLLDKIDENHEPYDREYMLQMVYTFCSRNSCIARNVSITSLYRNGYKDGVWETHNKWVSYISFEIDEVTKAKLEFLDSLRDYWGDVKFQVLPDDWKTTILCPSEFTETM